MNYYDSYIKNGFVKFPLLSKNEVDGLRAIIKSSLGENEFSRPQLILTSNLLKHPQLYEIFFNEKLVEIVKSIFGENAKYQSFEVQVNQYPKNGPGWHIDSQSEGSAAQSMDENYRIGKVGIYLQDNSLEYGGGIDIWRMGYKLFPPSSNRIFNRILIKLYRRINWNLFGKRFGRSVPIQAGEVVIFDSRLPHTGTPSKNYGNYNIPEEKLKNVMYVDVSDEYSAKKYLNHNLKRAADAELRINDQDVYWTDYLRLRYPDDYPKDFLKLANKAEIHIESLDKQECELWKFIYDYRARNQSNSNFID